MNRATFIIFAVLLTACGGAPFTDADEAIDAGTETDARHENAPDAADDATSDGGASEAAPREGGEPESSTIEDGGVNTDSMVLDSSPTCTPVPVADGQCAGHPLTVPMQLCEEIVTGSNAIGQVADVPDACRCQETYTCDCIVQMFPCGLGQAPSCSTSNNPPYNEFIVEGCN